MTSMQYVDWMNAAQQNLTGRDFFPEFEVNAMKAFYEGRSDVDVILNPETGNYQYVGNYNWYEMLNKKTYPMQQYNLSVTGGTKDVRYYLSAGYFNQKGLAKFADENYDRFNVMTNTTFRANSWIEMGLRTTLNITDDLSGPVNNSNDHYMTTVMLGDARPIMPLRHPDGNFAGNVGPNGNFTNLAAVQSQGGHTRQKANDVTTTALIVLTPFAGFKVNADYTYQYHSSIWKRYSRRYLDHLPDGTSSFFSHTNPPRVFYEQWDNRYQSFNLYGTYEMKFGKHEITPVIGFNQEWFSRRRIQTERRELFVNDIPSISLAGGLQTTTDLEEEWAIRGVFFRANYIYDEKYIFEVVSRYDGSSRFPKPDRFAVFPSVSAGWRVSKENFWSPLSDVVNELKIRGSYSSLGNQVTAGFYPYIANFGSEESAYLFGSTPGRLRTFTTPGLVSPHLTWETIVQQGLGVDFEALDKRLFGSFDVYARTTKDMLSRPAEVPAILGVGEPDANIADLRTKGWELLLGWNERVSTDLSYGITFTLWDWSAEITKFQNPAKSIGVNWNPSFYEGMTFGEIWGFVSDGLFKDDTEAAAWTQTGVGSPYAPRAGDMKFKDLDGEAGITRGANTVDNPGDRKIIGNSTPRYSFGLRLTAEWRGFDAAMFFQGVMKRDVWPSNMDMFLNHYGSQWAVPLAIHHDFWREDNQNALFPRPRFNGGAMVGNTGNMANTRFLQNAAYVRLKQLTVGYTVPFRHTDRIGVSKCRVYFSANNLWEAHNMFETFDPEIARVNAYPLFRSFSIGANLTF